ncbi:unnamed protein product [Sphagnum jensenii]|uniref:Uncharacterized protein n=2 Tax=Sphagnum jensenii TaxID=128206 RepID=A0ABP0WG11_9BRYO
MENLFKKIQELQDEACRLKEEEKERQKGYSASSPQPSSTWNFTTDRQQHSSRTLPPWDGEWLRAFRKDAGPWNGEKLVVLSLFDGIGGIWAALTRLGIPFTGYSSEVSIPALEVLKAKYPEVHHVGDVRKVERMTVTEKVDLVVGGFPCQDLSCMGKREGLHGQRSKLFFDLLHVLKIFNPSWFLVENVASMTWMDRDEISKYLKLQPIELDSIELAPSKRRRLYWTNIPHPARLPRVKNHPSTFVQSCLLDGIALEEKTGIILSNNSYKSNSCQMELVLENGTSELRYLSHVELERIMGYPSNHTSLCIDEAENNSNPMISNVSRYVQTSNTYHKKRGKICGVGGPTRFCTPPASTLGEPLKDSVRWALLGNTFTVPVIAYLVSPLLKSSVRVLAQPVTISDPVKESECSVMDPDDVWALYNEHERPNWYALILRRSGDRFSRCGRADKKNPLRIEMQYLEITQPYLEGEEDSWNMLRGTGLFELRQQIDCQISWVTFSHRVTSVVKVQDKFFIYPGQDEVWAVCSRKAWSNFFVYVVESSIDISRLQSGRPGNEGFTACCHLLIKTTEHETYRKTNTTLEFTDISLFCFRAPYVFKQQANMLRLEVGAKGRKVRNIESGIRRSKRKRKDTPEALRDDVNEEGEGYIANVFQGTDRVEQKGRAATTDIYDVGYGPQINASIDEESTQQHLADPETIIISDDDD